MTQPDPLAVAAMVAHCGWDPTVVTDETVALDGNGTTLLTLESMHVTEVSEIVVTDRWGDDTTLVVGPGGDADWTENGCLIWNGCGVWPEGQRNVSVSFKGGYANPPADLLAALNSVSKRVSGPTFGATTAKMGTAVVSFGAKIASGDLLVVEVLVFDRYRLPRAK